MAEEINIYFGATSLQTCLGDKVSTLSSMSRGICGLRYVEDFGMTAGVIDTLPPSPIGLPDATRFEILAADGLKRILDASGLKLSDPSVQLIISTTKGNVELLAKSCDRINADAYLYNSAVKIAERFDCAVKPVVISNACISGVSAFVVARDMLLEGACRHVAIVGCDVLSEFITAGFASFKSISEDVCRPYDEHRDGLSLGEACGAVLLTTDEHLAEKPLIRLTGGAVTNDANHISGPSRTGDGLFYAVSAAMREAGVDKSEIGFVNTHGTATLYNDEMECKAVVWAGLDNVPLNGVKGYIGHTLGASGVVETIICAEELRLGYIFGTKGYDKSGISSCLCISNKEQKFNHPCCIKSASGFGGCNAAIVLDGGDSRATENFAAGCKYEIIREYVLPHPKQPFDEFIREEYRKLASPNMKFFKMSDLCKAVYVAAERLLADFDISVYEPVRRAVVLSNSVSSLEADAAHQRIVNRHLAEGASPAVFVYTLPNVAAGELCIRHKFQGDNTFFIEDEDTGRAEHYAGRLIAANKADLVVCGWCDKLDDKLNVRLKLITKI